MLEKDLEKLHKGNWLESVKQTKNNPKMVDVEINGLNGEIIRYRIYKTPEKRNYILD